MPTRVCGTLLTAYRGAIYRIDTDPAIDLRIGQRSALPPASATGTAQPGGVFMTACNPRSRRLRPVANARRMRVCIRALGGRPWLAGRAIDPAGIWPEEPSLWIPGCDPADGLRLARRFGQNAFVWCDADGVARLWWAAGPPEAIGIIC